MRFVILKMGSISIAVFWNVAPFVLVDKYRPFKGKPPPKPRYYEAKQSRDKTAMLNERRNSKRNITSEPRGAAKWK